MIPMFSMQPINAFISSMVTAVQAAYKYLGVVYRKLDKVDVSMLMLLCIVYNTKLTSLFLNFSVAYSFVLSTRNCRTSSVKKRLKHSMGFSKEPVLVQPGC